MRDSRPILFIARQQEDGKYAVLNVDVFGVGGYVPTAALSAEHVAARTNFITRKWCAEAAERHAKFRAETGNVPPGHWQHHNDKNNDERPKVGYGCELRLGSGLINGNDHKDVLVNGEKMLIAGDYNPNKLYMNFRGIEPDAFEAIRNERLPFRSVEILDPSVPDIGSIAFMYSRPPFFGLRPLVVVLDTSRKEPAFKFQPAPMAASAQFSSTGKARFYTFMENSEMKTELLALAKTLKPFSANAHDLSVRMRLAFAADASPPDEDEMKEAAKKVFATEEKGQGTSVSSDAQPSGSEEKGQGTTVSSDKEETGKEEKAQGTTVSTKKKLSAEEEAAEKAKKDKEANAGSPQVKMEAGGFPPKKDEEKKDEKPAEEGKEAKAKEKPAAAPPAPAAPAAAAPAPTPPVAPSAAGAPAPAGPVPVPGAMGGQPSPGAQQAGMGVSTMIQGILEQAFAPLVQEVRGLLAGTPQGAPPVNQLAPIVSMAAMRFAADFPAKFTALLTSAMTKEPAKFAATMDAKPADAELPAQFKAELAAAQAQAKEAIEKLSKFDAKFAALESEKKFEARKAQFKAQLEEEVKKSGNTLRIDVDAVAQAAAEMPVQTKKFMGREGKLEDREVDLGVTHVNQVLEQAGLTAPPPPAAGYSVNGKQVNVDDCLAPYAGNPKAFSAAQVAAKDWDDNKAIQRMSKKESYIASEVRFATGFAAAVASGNGVHKF